MINAVQLDLAVDNNNRAHQLFRHPEDMLISIIHPQLHLLHLLDRMPYVNWQPIEMLRQ